VSSTGSVTCNAGRMALHFDVLRHAGSPMPLPMHMETMPKRADLPRRAISCSSVAVALAPEKTTPLFTPGQADGLEMQAKGPHSHRGSLSMSISCLIRNVNRATRCRALFHRVAVAIALQRTCGAQRVAHRDGAAVGVHLGRVQVQHIAAVRCLASSQKRRSFTATRQNVCRHEGAQQSSAACPV
jgi:hypothetical protein